MQLKLQIIDCLAGKFYEALYNRKWTGALEPHVSRLSIADAYKVQDLVTRMRLNKGEVVAGYKIGSYLKKGSLVISGSPVELVSLKHDVELKVEIERVGYLAAVFNAPP